MVTFLKAIINFLINPLHVVIILLILALVMHKLNQAKWGKWSLWAAMAYLLIAASDPLPQYLMECLEDDYTPIDVSQLNPLDSALYIMVLGSGHTADPDLPETGQLALTALSRLTEGVRLAQILPHAKLVFSGFALRSQRSQAEVMAAAAQSLGVPTRRIETLALPTTTAEEALAFKKSFDDASKLLLVSSASHMPRAMQIFRNSGLNPIPAPTDFRIKDEPDDGIDLRWFSHANLLYVQIVLHEYIGMLWEEMNFDKETQKAVQ